MRPVSFTIILIIGLPYWACNCNAKVEVTDVKYVSEIQTENPPEPPPPPRSNLRFMTLNEWLFRICETEKPDKSVIAFNFGLFETENGYTIYLIGSKEYDKDNPDWATNSDFEPSLKYYPLPPSEYRNLKFEEVLDKIKSKLKDFTKTEKFKNSFFAKAKAITVGFDEGDLEMIK